MFEIHKYPNNTTFATLKNFFVCGKSEYLINLSQTDFRDINFCYLKFLMRVRAKQRDTCLPH